MLARERYASMALVDAVDEAGERRCKADDECYD